MHASSVNVFKGRTDTRKDGLHIEYSVFARIEEGQGADLWKGHFLCAV